MCGAYQMQKQDFLKITEDIKDGLNSELLKVRSGQTMNWNFVRRNLETLYLSRSLPITVVDKGMFYDFFRFLMGIFDSHKIEDSSLVEDVLQYICFTQIAAPDDFFDWFKLMSEKLIPSHSYQVEDTHLCNSIHILRKISYDGKMYSGGEKLKDTSNCYINIIWVLANRGMSSLLSILLKHGVMYLQPTDTWKMSDIYYILYTLRNNDGNDDPIATINRSFKDVKYSPRFLEALRATVIICSIKKGTADASQLVYCFRKIYSSIREPFITVQEVRAALDRIVPKDHNKYSEVERLCKEFENHFEESTGPRTPRSLKHLSRCQIRESMSKVLGLPYKVSSLPIPMHLQKYINLEII